MKKILKSLVAAMIVSATIVTVSTPTTTHAASGDWRKDSIGWWYRNSDGSYPKNKWERIGDK